MPAWLFSGTVQRRRFCASGWGENTEGTAAWWRSLEATRWGVGTARFTSLAFLRRWRCLRFSVDRRKPVKERNFVAFSRAAAIACRNRLDQRRLSGLFMLERWAARFGIVAPS